MEADSRLPTTDGLLEHKSNNSLSPGVICVHKTSGNGDKQLLFFYKRPVVFIFQITVRSAKPL